LGAVDPERLTVPIEARLRMCRAEPCLPPCVGVARHSAIADGEAGRIQAAFNVELEKKAAELNNSERQRSTVQA
jgi:hypothetical protein